MNALRKSLDAFAERIALVAEAADFIGSESYNADCRRVSVAFLAYCEVSSSRESRMAIEMLMDDYACKKEFLAPIPHFIPVFGEALSNQELHAGKELCVDMCPVLLEAFCKELPDRPNPRGSVRMLDYVGDTLRMWERRRMLSRLVIKPWHGLLVSTRSTLKSLVLQNRAKVMRTQLHTQKIEAERKLQKRRQRLALRRSAAGDIFDEYKETFARLLLRYSSEATSLTPGGPINTEHTMGFAHPTGYLQKVWIAQYISAGIDTLLDSVDQLSASTSAASKCDATAKSGRKSGPGPSPSKDGGCGGAVGDNAAAQNASHTGRKRVRTDGQAGSPVAVVKKPCLVSVKAEHESGEQKPCAALVKAQYPTGSKKPCPVPVKAEHP